MSSNYLLLKAVEATRKLRADPRILSVEIVGSLRRGHAKASDVDLLVIVDDPEKFVAGDCPTGAHKSTDKSGPFDPLSKADLFVSSPQHQGAALVFSTGPRELNWRLRGLARGRKLVFDFPYTRKPDWAPEPLSFGKRVGLYSEKGEAVETRSEHDFFAALGLPYVPASHREWMNDVLEHHPQMLGMPARSSSGRVVHQPSAYRGGAGAPPNL